MSPSVAVFDIDGTVADARHRLHLVRGSTSHDRWRAFFDAAADDPPIPEGIATATSWARRCEIYWCTGRPERIRELTVRWLREQGLPPEHLTMYPSGDSRPTREIKVEYIRELAARRRIAVVVDDDPRVIELLRRTRIPVNLARWIPWENPVDGDGLAAIERH